MIPGTTIRSERGKYDVPLGRAWTTVRAESDRRAVCMVRPASVHSEDGHRQMKYTIRRSIAIATSVVVLASATFVVLELPSSASASQSAVARASALTEARGFHAVFSSTMESSSLKSGIRQSGIGDVSAGAVSSKIESVNVHTTGNPWPQSIDSILRGGKLYWTTADLPLPKFARERPWLSEPAPQMPGESIVAAPDPIDVLDLLQTTSAVESMGGNAMVGTEPTRHYRFVLDLSADPSQLATAGVSPRMRPFLEQYLGNSIRADVYVSKATGEIVRVSATTSSTIRSGVTTSFSDSYSNYGEHTAIVAPPSGQVTPESALGG